MSLEIEKHTATNFIATAFGGSNGQTLLNIPKDVVGYLKIDRGDKVEITIRKTGLKSLRKRASKEIVETPKEVEAPVPDGSV